MAKDQSIGSLSDGELELIVIEEFSRAESLGYAVNRDCELTLAQMVAERFRNMARDTSKA